MPFVFTEKRLRWRPRMTNSRYRWVTIASYEWKPSSTAFDSFSLPQSS
jgi:hypothetical protein